MAEATTGQLDQLIESKINTKINDFTQSITDQITKFLEENGEYSPTRITVPDGWKTQGHAGSKVPVDYTCVYTSDFRKSLSSGIADAVKKKMIARATKELLDKVSLLS
jgi:hypothetical protein